ncbi:MAG: IS1634 family transposase [Coriobacteriia bacterium]|nr:IS1634 family transposase [Coriobacteriia bacterium]
MKRGKAYFYLVESARVAGKPRIVRQVYLGKAADLLARLDAAAPQSPTRVRMREFGASMAALAVAAELGLCAIVDEVVPKRAQGVSVGTHFTLAALNRVAAPCSKSRMGAWYERSALSSHMKLKAADLAPQRFWDAMDRLGESELSAIESRLGEAAIERFGVDTSALVLDATDFFTFIDSATPGDPARRGHSKQKRHDLRQVGLALLVSTDSCVPLSSLCYPGNMADSRSFAGLSETLIERYRTFSSGVDDITLVFDKGNNSAASFASLDASPCHFVGSLVPTRHPELLALDLSTFSPVEGYAGVFSHRVTKEVFGVSRTLVVTFSEELYLKQRRGLDQTLAKASRQLSDVSALLVRRRHRRSIADVDAMIAEICEPRWVRPVMHTELTEGPGGLVLDLHLDEGAREEIERVHFGKRILFTDRTDLSDAQVVAAYRSQSVVENAFRQMKDPTFISFSPMFHWTDDKIRVHVFYCVVALMIANLMWRRIRAAGIDISPKAMLAELSRITLVDLVYAPTGGIGRPKVRSEISELSDLQQSLVDALGLAEYMPGG